MNFTTNGRAACSALALGLALSLGGAGGAAAQSSLPFSMDPSMAFGYYAYLGPALVNFLGGGQENAVLLGFGVRAPVSGGGSLPNASAGIEAEMAAFTGPGAGWGIQRVRAVYQLEPVERMRISVAGGYGRIHDNLGNSEAGASFGVRAEYALSDALAVGAFYNRNTTTTGIWETEDFGIILDLDF